MVMIKIGFEVNQTCYVYFYITFGGYYYMFLNMSDCQTDQPVIGFIFVLCTRFNKQDSLSLDKDGFNILHGCILHPSVGLVDC